MKKHLKQLDLKRIRITDSLFGEYVNKVSEKIIPHQWKILNDQLEDSEPTYCIRNFRIAAGEEKGERKGVVFQDTVLYKWLESVAYTIAGGRGENLEELADEVIDLIGKAQEPDGYLNTYFSINAPTKKWTNLVEGHELYTAGHMIEAAVAYYQATGKEKFLNIARKNADLICRVFGTGEGQKRGYPGHQEIELALVKLYRVTGERAYLHQAEYFIRERGRNPNYLQAEIEGRGHPEFFPEFERYDLEYSQAHKPPVEQDEAVGHAVREMYMCSAMADLAGENDDQQLKDACQRIWNNMTDRRMYITGGIGSSGFRERFTTDYDLPNSTNYSETCASIGVMMFGQRMAAITGDASYYDYVEKALYNTVIAGINIAGDRYFYVNPLEVVPEFCTEHTYMEHVKPVRQKWFGVACCPPNVGRTLASLGQYIYAEDEYGVYINQFISSTADTEVRESRLKIKMNSTLLQDGKVQIEVQSSGPGNLNIRIPWYSEKCECVQNGISIEIQPEKGYQRLSISPGDTYISLDFHVSPRWMGANNGVRADAGKAALMKGPLVYCLEEKENGRYLSEIFIEENTSIEETAPAEELVGNVPTLSYKGIRVRNKGAAGENQLYGNVELEKEEVSLQAVPYCMWNNRGEGEMLVWHKLRV